MLKAALLIAICISLPANAQADAPAIEKVTADRNTDSWTFHVPLSHPDTGWDHYADGWRILDMQGRELGRRVLVHPHETEQPFTRSKGGITLPHGVTQVQVQARCTVDGWATQTVVYTLP
ncbi:MAG: hypothetical protein BM562_11795 [Alphaproteobacteria bacterium MedPE-SWcel]|nr:MAG: hypothetical protein BM562_11795 [Alphaproteobacteria bacterium MedPE-SWcel]